MQLKKLVGQGASSKKYDVLTAVLTLAAQDQGADGRLALRLSVLITARFNWRTETFAVGLREIARLWGVTERTAKREMAQMRARGWVSVHRASAKGRVAEHRIDLPVLMRATLPYWPAIGSDFVARMSDVNEPDVTSNVIPITRAEAPQSDGTLWSAAAAALHQQDASTYSAWFSGLQEAECQDGVLVLYAPSSFVAHYVQTHLLNRLIVAVCSIDPRVRTVGVVAPAS